ncbi:carbohydrate ABC transporter permease [Actinorugispora endophytica]|uniref:Raffinose/stachyose/melibiose transport system permease protein n=1 Tax=Actinorugispora endophytica TaxID=1605990 RepID=A0A4R6UWC4_9ACTN|nr:carbohydrate ABC transporter permease [Actinorugispora endophytica]TDQ51551.1 raffinose/stachyose/melibiose transport system permease protein [Actinorugispora endophytica]
MRSRGESVISHLILVLGAAIALYPALSILVLAVSERGGRPSPLGMPRSFTLDNFARAWEGGGFDTALLSSAVVAVSVVVVTVTLSVLTGYALAWLRVPMAGPILGVLLIGLVLPYEGVIVPLHSLVKDLGMINTTAALILPQIGLSVSLGVFWMTTYFRGVPRSLPEAASIDGASRFQTLTKVMLPAALPGVSALALIVFLYAWNDFLLALVLVPDNADVRTAPLALSFFAGNVKGADIGVTAAAAVLVALPLVVVYVVLQRSFISGLLGGAVKE